MLAMLDLLFVTLGLAQKKNAHTRDTDNTISKIL